MTHMQTLEATFDGSIPAHLRREAMLLDAAGVAPDEVFHLPRRRSPIQLVADMAQVMIDRAAASGACTEEHILAEGFTREELATHGDAARSRAFRLTSPRFVRRTLPKSAA